MIATQPEVRGSCGASLRLPRLLRDAPPRCANGTRDGQVAHTRLMPPLVAAEAWFSKPNPFEIAGCCDAMAPVRGRSSYGGPR